MMKCLFSHALILFCAVTASCQSKIPFKDIREGDVVFQSNISPQCEAIRQATHSVWTHCGMVFKQDGKLYVYEAIEPVTYTPLEDWAARSPQHFVVKRLKDTTVLTSAMINKMAMAGRKYKGKHYDSYFEWSDDRIYCSELVWKIYKEGTGLELGEPKPLRSYDLSSEIVKRTMEQRYGNNIPLTEKMIAPSSIYASTLLKTIYEAK
ncbi:YiiX family permuted papain-like enzyme [Chitinophaga sedimenti]|uniref:YiiX family permuted papain-like enzyme n=1 Tax=Chitinophaga sedimenti TaxID=2033606 RepID=UPI0020057D5A|nr:YiiX family permuted papain-like enzyme [Chitinophaga sedimenti]MCK7558622.1 YiiX family permuted papain-like enzyme [Chitinophaga sedimenti]